MTGERAAAKAMLSINGIPVGIERSSTARDGHLKECDNPAEFSVERPSTAADLKVKEAEFPVKHSTERPSTARGGRSLFQGYAHVGRPVLATGYRLTFAVAADFIHVGRDQIWQLIAVTATPYFRALFMPPAAAEK